MQHIKNKLFLLATTIALGVSSSFAAANDYPIYNKPSKDEKHYNLNLSLYRNYGTQMGVDAFYSVMEGYRFLVDETSEYVPGWAQGLVNFLIVAPYITTWNHEASGHALTRKQFGGDVSTIRVDLLFPWRGDAYTSFNSLLPNTQKNIVVSIAGMQADDLFANKITFNSIQNKRLNPVDSAFYLWSYLDQFMYIRGTDEKKSGDDIASYIKEINQVYGNGSITQSCMKNYNWFDLLNPMVFYSFYSVFTNSTFSVPMIPLFGNIKWLPAVKYVITPSGYQFNLNNYFVAFDKTLNVIVGGGRTYNDKTTYSAQLNIPKFVELTEKLSIGINAALWKQPELFGSTPKTESPKFGGMVIPRIEYTLMQNFNIYTEIGYKTNGFILGQTPEKSFILGGGLNYYW